LRFGSPALFGLPTCLYGAFLLSRRMAFTARRISTTPVLRVAELVDAASVRAMVREETAREGKTAEVLATSVKDLVREQLVGLKTELGAAEKTLNASVGSVKTELTAQVGSVKTELTTALNEKVGGVEKSLTAQVGSMKNELAAQEKVLTAKIEEKVGGLEKALTAAVKQQEKLVWQVIVGLLISGTTASVVAAFVSRPAAEKVTATASSVAPKASANWWVRLWRAESA
jgi:hypothetical protein